MPPSPRTRPASASLSLASLALLLGCLPTVAPQDGGPPDGGALDAGVFEVRAFEVASRDGAAHSPHAAPRAPELLVRFSGPLGDDVQDAVFVLARSSDEALLEDAARRPLRAETLAHVVECEVEIAGRTARLSVPPQAPGVELTVLVGAWLERDDGLSLGAPWSTPVRVGSDPRLGAAATDLWPPDGAASVPTELTEIVARFDGELSAVTGALELRRGERLLDVSSQHVDCASVGWSSGHCVALRAFGALEPGASYQVRVGPEARDASGAAPPAWEASFTTARGADTTPPSWLVQECAIDEAWIEDVGCGRADDESVVMRVLVDEPAVLELRGAERSSVTVAPRGEAELRLEGLRPGVVFSAELLARDLAGRTRTVPFELGTTTALATLSIVEVRADPRGREPHQELVEVLNYGAVSIPLAGVALADRPDSVGDVLTTPLALAPGQRALLVADAFDPDDAEDAQPPAGALIVRVGSSLASGGLRNAGEALYLRDGLGRRLSASPATAVEEGQCLIRQSADGRTGDTDAFASGECTPGRAP